MIIAPMHEFNHCHSKADGKFCAEPTIVGMTSQRPEGDPKHQTNKAVFETMRQFESNLKALPGVTDVKVQPGLGAWEGGNEATWVVSYRGNGAATRLLAKVGKDYDQDAILMLKGCSKGTAGCSPVVELEFDTPVSGEARDAVHDVLGTYRKPDGSLIMGGWTWFKRNGKTVLRMAAVPQWGGDNVQHVQTAAQISRALSSAGLLHTSKQRTAKVSIMERAGDHSYDRALTPALPVVPQRGGIRA